MSTTMNLKEMPTRLSKPERFKWHDLGILFVLVLVVILGTVLLPGFLSEGNIRSILTDAAFTGIVAVGITFVLVSGNIIDLSVVAQVAVAGTVVVQAQPAIGLWPAVCAAVLVLQLFAAINGFAVGALGANSVVVTLAVQTAGLGTLQYLSGGGQNLNQSASLNEHAINSFGPFPVPFVWLLLVVIVAHLIMTGTNFGFSTKAVGTHTVAALNSGVRSGKTVWLVFAFSSLLCALAGILLAGYNNNAISSMGTGLDFGALAAVVVGGASLNGGNGSVLKTFLGVMLISIMLNVLTIAGLPFNYQELVRGLIIIAAVAVDAALRRKGSNVF